MSGMHPRRLLPNLNRYIASRELADRKRYESTIVGGRRGMKRIFLFSLMGAFSLVGLLVSAYLTVLSFSPPSSCPVGDFSFLSCNEVIWSKYSHFYGVSVALLGLIWFIIVIGLLALAWKSERLVMVVVAWSLLGVVGVATFVYTELFLLGSVCPLCTIAHLSGLAISVLSIVTLRTPRETN
jgi:uncharacterized membrane protein